MEIPIDIIYKIAQEAHTMGRTYENLLSPVNPAIELGNVEKMVDRLIWANRDKITKGDRSRP